MNIKQLTLENFKCFKTEKTFDFSRLTILTGANSSGKSSVIHAILGAIQSGEFPTGFSTNGEYTNLGDFIEISNNYNPKNIIKIGFKYSFSKESRFHIHTLWENDKISSLPKRYKKIIDIPSFEDIDNPKLHTSTHEKGHKYLENSFNYISAFRQSPRRTYLEQNKAKYKIGTEGEEYIDQIVEWDKRSNGKIKELVKTMKGLDLIEDIKINRLGGGRFEVLVKPLNNKGFSALSDVGSGVSAFMPIIIGDLQLPNDSTLYLQEPETHLHPSVQSKFGGYIVDKINNTKKNYVIETHSEYFLNKIRLAIVKGELKKEDLKVYFLENTKDDTEVYDIDFTKTGAIKNAPKNFFDTYLMGIMDITLNAVAE
jgi:predicted ATPase